ncbi:early endosome antigen 1 isoform X2 [Amphiprion ocellaris]|uniref:early endosome antigen 1 isoform X2 n=1 Tax=Amphiprion ocellaris TaxID=80972 RepID=UPI00241164E1|nr:early endosome antigen 1 isoform X2 [Amphiprion ocellaris]
MSDSSHDGAERHTDKLLCIDPIDTSGVFGVDTPTLKLDHCDLLLDAMDAELSQLQVLPHKHEVISREHDCSNAAVLRWSQALSKDTGLGSTSQTNDTPMSCLDLIHTPTMEQTSENTTDCWKDPVTHEETKNRLHRARDKKETESRREQVIWRLQKLLGDNCEEGRMAEEAHPPSDSICTEDFVRRFKEEMVEVAMPDGSMQELDKEEQDERTKMFVSDVCQNEQNDQSLVDKRPSATAGEWSQDTVTAHCSLSNKPGQRKQRRKCPSDRVNTSHFVSHRTGVAADHENVQHNNSCSLTARCLAGVPVCSFDTVSIDSDLDTVSTEQVRHHIRKQPGWQALIRSVTDMNDDCTNQSDHDTPTQEESDTQPTLVQRSSYEHVQNTSLSKCKAQRNRRGTYRLVCSLSDNEKDTDEEIIHCSGRSRPERTSAKMKSDWATLKERLSNLQQKCEKEEETLRLKRTQLKDVELCLSELRQKRKHALQELERLTTETAQMEKDKRTLESVLRDSRMEKESVSCQLQKLQRQKESFLLEVRDMEKDLPILSKQTPKDGSCMNRNNVIMSVLEREEMERQLDNAKTELFAEQRRAREKLESMQEKLEETCEELHRATEAESSLRDRCFCLEEKLMQKNQQLEALEIQVSKLQGELGECKDRLGTLEKMLAQRELQLLDLKEQCGAFQAERDGLKGELQHLKTQHCKALKEAQVQVHRMKVNKQAEEEKAHDLKEEMLSLTGHIESMQSSIQLKEEEVIQLRKSLQQQREEAKKCEKEWHVEALEKVHKAVEEERRKYEAEKVEAVQVHCGILEEQHRKSLESLRSEMQQEKSKALVLQHQVVELNTRVQELESESCAQQREQESLLAVICKSLKEEHQAELQRSQRHMAKSQRAVLRLEQDVQLSVKETDRLRVMLEEKESSHHRITAEKEQQLRHWAQQLVVECQHLHRLVEQSGAKQSAGKLSPSLTGTEALAYLKTLREKLKHFISHLHQELKSQKQTNEHLRKDKERELSIQRQQLRVERDQALNSIKKRLIQEHIEELSSLKRAHLTDGGAEGGGGVAASLRKQLKAKDLELRQVQRSMAEWKEQTAARLACKFEEELTAELERCKAKLLRGRKASKSQEERHRKPEQYEEEMMFSLKEAQKSVCSPSIHAVDSAASQSPSDVTSFKLLCYLQSRVKQLRVENQAYMWSPPPPFTIPSDLSGSYLTTIVQGQDSAGTLGQSSIRTVSSEGHETFIV